MYPACSQPPPTVAWLVAPKTKTRRKAAHNARYFSFKFVNTEITIEYAKQRRWSARNSCVSGYRYGPTCKARKNRRDYYTAERGQEGEREREKGWRKGRRAKSAGSYSAVVLGATAANEIFYYSPTVLRASAPAIPSLFSLLQPTTFFHGAEVRLAKNKYNTGQRIMFSRIRGVSLCVAV